MSFIYLIRNAISLKTAAHILLLLCILIPSGVHSQSYWENYELLSTRTGLSDNSVLAIVQDSRHLLWIGTRNGLCIYDGYDFEVKKNLFNINEEWNNVFTLVFKDRQDNIWVGTQTGRIGKFPAGRYDSMIIYATDTLLPREYSCSAYQDVAGTIWMGSNSGRLFFIDQAERRLRHKYDHKDYFNSIQEDEAGNIILGGTSIVVFPGQKQGKPKPGGYFTLKGSHATIHNPGGTIAVVKDPEIFTRRNYLTYKCRSGNLLLASSQLIKEYDTTGKLISRIVISDNPNYNSDDISNCIYEDASGILWLGTNFGLVKIKRDKYRFTKFVANSTSSKLNSNYVRSVFVDNKQNIWVGYKDGIPNVLTFDSTNKKYKSITCEYYPLQHFTSVNAASINIIRQLRSGMVLLGGIDGLFYTRGKNGETPVLYRFLIKDSENNYKNLFNIWSVYEDRYGRIWVGTHSDGLYIINPVTHAFRHYPYQGITSESHGLTSAWKIFEDHKGTIWLGTINGLDSVYLDNDGYPSGFYNLHDHYKGHPGKQVWSIIEDNRNRLWIGTTDNGLSMVDKNRSSFITYNQKSGFPGNIICGIEQDREGFFWIGTVNGISKFDPVAGTVVQNFSENDGLPGNNYNFNACYHTSSGQLFFGSKTGLVAFHPQDITTKPVADVPVLIRTFSLWNETYTYDPDTRKPLLLRHNQNYFSFRFALPDYITPATHSFRYLLDGFDDHWTTVDARHPIATYTNVPPGEYTLLVKGSADGRRWNKDVTKLSISIHPAFWQHIVFRITALVLIIGGISFLIYMQFKRSVAKEREKSRIRQQFAELEFRALQAQMNPHFIFNSINAIQHFIFTNNEVAANDYLSKFARLMRLYLESSKNKYIPLSEEIELLQSYIHLEQLRFSDKFDYTFSIDPYFKQADPEIPSMLLQPYVENAINHGLAPRHVKGMLHISFIKLAAGISCIIEDNGVGRNNTENKKTHREKSRGMAITMERLNAYRAMDNIETKVIITDKTDDNGNSAGTKVEIFIPASV